MNNIGRYKREVTEDNELKKVLSWIDKSVQYDILEVGCNAGDFSKELWNLGHRIVGIDIDSELINAAKPYCEAVFVCNLDNMDDLKILNPRKFDFILILHVLEHLQDPWLALSRIKFYLKEEGTIVIGLPNISNMQNRINIFYGNFYYEETGVMDKTHLRFFNFYTASDLIKSAGLTVEEYFSPIQIDPSYFLSQIFPPKFKTIGRKLLNAFKTYTENDTDVVMLFKCKLNGY